MASTTSLPELRALLPSVKSVVSSFASSGSSFKPLYSVPQDATSSVASPRTLYVLDSSFNPPTKAHLRIATSALLQDRGADPKRLLLLLATQNADKAPKPASFEHRIALMTIFAEDVRIFLDRSGHSPTPIVDIALTSLPYFVDKAKAIHSSHYYSSSPEQVHLTGYDTLVRILDPKYYPPAHTLAPLDPFLSNHRLRVTYRTDDKWGGMQEQVDFLRALENGDREHEGGKREWAQRIKLVDGRVENEEVISSTKVREAAKMNDLEALKGLVTDGTAQWIVEEGLYTEK